MEHIEKTIIVIKFLLLIAPASLYFITLGLVYSRSEPSIVSSRRDWFTLVGILSSIAGYPAAVLMLNGSYILGILLLAMITISIIVSSPPKDMSWIIYNTDEEDIKAIITNYLKTTGLSFTAIPSKNTTNFKLKECTIRISSIPFMRMVNISIETRYAKRKPLYAQHTSNLTADPTPERTKGAIAESIIHTLKDQLTELPTYQLNPIGPILLITGTAMFSLPILLALKEVNSIVKTFNQLFAG